MTNSTVKNFSINATDVRKDWSNIVDTVVHKKPVFIKRTHDNIMMINSVSLSLFLEAYKFHIEIFREDDGSYTASVKEIDIICNGPTKEVLIQNVITDLRDYASDYYEEFDYWYSSMNRKEHAPYVMKILLSTDKQLMEALICHIGKN